MSSEKRMAAIYDFNNQISNVLVTTELANRGFSYPPIDAIISFDPCEVFEEELLRMSRSNKAGA
jgi:superfamily II DNA/RNA helicase